MKNSIKIRLAIITIAIIGFLFYGFRDNGSVLYYGQSYTAGSVFNPDSYLSAGLFKSAGKEINKLVSKKRGSSLTGVMVSAIVGGITFFTLWQDDDFKDILVEAIKQGEIIKMANLDNYLILVFIVVTGILIAIQFAGERLVDWLTDLTEQFFSKSLDKHEEKRRMEREEDK